MRLKLELSIVDLKKKKISRNVVSTLKNKKNDNFV